ncbi:MAG: DUF2723 domain-containing protein [Vicinamibacteria bacterium]
MPPETRRDLRALSLASGVSAVSFFAYWLTHGSGPFWQDSGLFLAGLKVGGGLLPPGYPVYVILGRAFVAVFETVLPGRAFAEGGNMFSAVWASLAAGLVTLSILTLRQRGYRFFSNPAAPSTVPEPTTSWPGAVIGGLLASFSYSLWFQALTAEAYAMNAFFSAAVLFLVIRLGGEGPLGENPTKAQHRLVLLLLITHGLSFGNHPVTVVFVPAIAWLAWINRELLRNRRFLLTAAFVYVTSALLPYLYLLYAARAHPEAPYSGVATFGGFLAQISGAQWSGESRNYGISPERLSEVALQLWREFFAVGLVGALVGLWWMKRAQPALLRLMVVILIPALLLPLLYRRGGEYDFWLMSAFMVLFVVSGSGLGILIDRMAGPKGSSARARLVAAGIGVLTLTPLLGVNPALVDGREYFVPEDFGRNLYRHLEPGAVFVAMSDQENALTYYLDVVAHERPDVIRIDGGVLTTPWFTDQLKSRYPQFAFEDPSQGGAKPASTEDWLSALIRASVGRRAFYMTSVPSVAIPENAEWIPAGGLFKLRVRSTAGIDRRDWDYSYRNPQPFDRPARNHAPAIQPDGTILREPYTAQIRRFHVQAWKNLGDWSLDQDDYQEAAKAYESALRLDPSLDNAWVFFGLGKALFVLDRPKDARPYLERVGARLPDPLAAETALYLGQISAGQGDNASAARYFDTVRRLAPELGPRLPPVPLGVEHRR